MKGHNIPFFVATLNIEGGESVCTCDNVPNERVQSRAF